MRNNNTFINVENFDVFRAMKSVLSGNVVV